MTLNRIPVTVLTGYLGSGKTTLLNYILGQNHGLKIAVIENEFGEIGVDQDIVIQADEEIFEMNNGCVCCSVRGDLVRILDGLKKRKNKFDRIIIETTGVADPAPVIQTFLAEKSLRDDYYLDGVITLVDAKHFLIQVERSPEVKRQIAYADKLVLTKSDLVTKEELEKVYSALRLLSPKIGILTSDLGQINLNSILEIKTQHEEGISESFKFTSTKSGHIPFSLRPLAKENHAQHEIGVSSLAIEVMDKVANPMMLETWLSLFARESGERLYRLKGIVAIRNREKKIIIQGIHSMIDFSDGAAWKDDEPRRSVLVAIGKGFDEKMIEESFKKCFRE
ncbi:MAG: GTP-binding protein [Bacteriovoracaceae bacterium]|nr:GTP-binding protein [Bacteriovoracaceae bacterium]